MQCTIQAGAFLQALKATKAAINSSYARSIAPYVILRARDGRVSLFAYTADLHIAVDLTEASTIEQEGEVGLWHQQALKGVEAFQGRVCLHYEEGDGKRRSQAILSSGDEGSLHQVPINCEDIGRLSAFPMRYEVGATYTHKINERVECETCHCTHAEERTSTYLVVKRQTERMHLTKTALATVLQRVQWLAEEYSYRSTAFTGVCMEVVNNQVSLLAADGFCVAVGTQVVEGAGSWEYPTLVPAMWFAKALKALPKQCDVQIEVDFDFHQLVQENEQEVCDAPLAARASEMRLVVGHVEVTLLPIQGKLPAYRSVIPEQLGPTRVLLSRVDLLNALKAVTPTAEYTGSSVWFHIASTTAHFEVKQHPESALRGVPVLERDGPDVSLPFRWQTLLAPLQAMRSSQVVLELDEPTKPFVLRPCDSEEGGLIVIMPTKG